MLNLSVRQKGIVPIITVIVVAALIGLGFWSIKAGVVKISLPETKSNPTLTSQNFYPAENPFAVTTVTPSPSPTITKTPTVKTPAPTVTVTPNTAPSCNAADYDLSAATGAVRFIFNPIKGGSLYWPITVEVKTRNGCKILEGKSTDTIQSLKPSTENNLSIPGLPPGTYELRYSYHYIWVSSQTATVVSGQQTDVTFSVDNSSDP
jgi:hypothetical protein